MLVVDLPHHMSPAILVHSKPVRNCSVECPRFFEKLGEKMIFVVLLKAFIELVFKEINERTTGSKLQTHVVKSKRR